MIAQLASCRPDHLTPRGSHLTRYDVRGDTARSLLLTILQEFVLPEGRPVWTSSLLQVLYETGVGGSAARQAISRAAGVGWIVGERQGREACWSIARAGRLLMEGETSWRECPNHDEWDKRWLIILIAIPQAQRNERKKLYGILLNAGFGNPKPGIWLTPHLDRTVVARSAVEGLHVE